MIYVYLGLSLTATGFGLWKLIHLGLFEEIDGDEALYRAYRSLRDGGES